MVEGFIGKVGIDLERDGLGRQTGENFMSKEIEVGVSIGGK
jgi:hypothetical protein